MDLRYLEECFCLLPVVKDCVATAYPLQKRLVVLKCNKTPLEVTSMARDLGFAPTHANNFYFLSYNSEDQHRVSRYAKHIAERGLPIWYDKGIEVGSLWEKSIADHIEKCQCFVMFVTRGIFTKAKSYVKSEFEMATMFKKKVVVVLLDEITIADIDNQYKLWWIDILHTQCINAYECDTVKQCADKIFDALGFDEASQPTVNVTKSSESGEALTIHPVDARSNLAKTQSTRPVSEDGYRFPPIDLLASDVESVGANKLIKIFTQNNVKVEKITYSNTTRITRYEVTTEPNSRMHALAKTITPLVEEQFDTTQVRIEVAIPHKAPNVIAIELPRQKSEEVFLRALVENEQFSQKKWPLCACLGESTLGEYQYLNISELPHLLVAGGENSGRLGQLNAILTGILYKSSPKDVRFLLIDTTERLTCFNNLPHLLVPVITDMPHGVASLDAIALEMEKRFYELMHVKARNIDDYNGREGVTPLPRIVVIVNDLADLMVHDRKMVENSVMRLAQKARATGIHIIATTEKPYKDVLTGVIKSNICARIAFTVPNLVDSYAILDGAGAEKLLDSRDMLYRDPASTRLMRIQGAYVSDEEVVAITDFINQNNTPAEFNAYFAMNIKRAVKP